MFDRVKGQYTTIAQDAVPVIEARRKIPFAMYNEFKIDFDRMKKGGIIKKVTQALEWISAMHIMLQTKWKAKDLHGSMKTEQSYSPRAF